MEDFQAGQGSAHAPLDSDAGHSAATQQTGDAPQSTNAGGQQGESKTPGLSAQPADAQASTPPWSPSPPTGGGQAQTPQGCTNVVALALGAIAFVTLLGAVILPGFL